METMSLKSLALQRINRKPEGKLCGNKQETFSTQKVSKVSNLKVVLLALGYPCTCGNILYRQRAYKWRDFDNWLHDGYQCPLCGTRYKFVCGESL